MKTANLQREHATDIVRGRANPHRATSRGITTRDSATDVEPVTDILFVGATVTDGDDGVAIVTIGGGAGGGSGSGSGGGNGTSSANAITVLNNSGQDLLPDDVVVTDETADNAVTVTSTEGDIRIAGVVQEPIAAGFFGKVLFNGYAAGVNAPGIVRGQYAKTSSTPTEAIGTDDREAGSFAVFMTGVDLADFAADAVTTTTDIPTLTLDIDIPTAPVDRVLFLALWLDASTSSISIPNWTRIGSTSGFYYFYRVTTGADAAVASWTGESVAVASVALLHESVSLALPIEDDAYDATNSAAALSGLPDAPHYALAGVDADVTPGSGFTRIAGGSASYIGSGTPALIQSKHYGNGSAGTTVTFDSTITQGNVVLMVSAQIDATSCHSTDPRDGGSCPADSHMTQLAGEYTHAASNGTVNLQGKTVTADTYSGPFGHSANCSLPAYEGLLGMEFSNATIAGAQTLQGYGNASAVDVGDFTGVGGDDLLVMAVQWRAQDGNNGFDPNISVNGFTQVYDGLMLNTDGGSGPVSWGWVGYKVGSGDASVTSSAAYSDQHWAAVAVLLSGASAAAGTLAGKYIAHDSSVTSPFSGSSQKNDGIFAVNLLRDAMPAALLYGPDLNADVGATASYAWQPLFNSGDGTAILDSGTGNPILAFGPV